MRILLAVVLTLAATLALPALASAASIEVLSPAAGTTVKPGESVAVRWKATGMGQLRTNIEACGNEGCFVVARISTYGEGTRRYTWTVSDLIPSGQYRLLVSSDDKGPSTMGYVPVTVVNKTGNAQSVSSVKVTPERLNRGYGKAALAVKGQRVGRYLVNANCPPNVSVKAGQDELCSAWLPFTASELRKLRLVIKNPDKAIGVVGLTVDVADPDAEGSIRKFGFIELGRKQ